MFVKIGDFLIFGIPREQALLRTSKPPENRPSFLGGALLRGCRNGRFGKRCSRPLPKTGGFDENRQKFRCCVLPAKTRDFAPWTLEMDEDDENGGCHPGRMNVAKSTILTTPTILACNSDFRA